MELAGREWLPRPWSSFDSAGQFVSEVISKVRRTGAGGGESRRHLAASVDSRNADQVMDSKNTRVSESVRAGFAISIREPSKQRPGRVSLLSINPETHVNRRPGNRNHRNCAAGDLERADVVVLRSL